MTLEEFRRDIYACIHCGECKVGPRSQMPICPSGERTGYNTTYACGFIDLARSLLEGKAEWSDSGIRNAIYSCMACGACLERCNPQVGIRTSDVFRELKAEFVRREQGPPIASAQVLESLAKVGNFFGQPRHEILQWADGLQVSEVRPGNEVVFFVGCYEAFDPQTSFIARAVTNLLNKAKVNWGVLGKAEVCCGYPALELGDEKLFRRLVRENIEKIHTIGPRIVVVACACCYGIMVKDWPQVLPLKFEVLHISQFALDLVREGRLKIRGKLDERVTLHDPCHLGRRGGRVYDAPRDLLQAIPGVKLEEMPRNRDESWCCGAGGCMNIHSSDYAQATAGERLREAARTEAETLVVPSCPICHSNFRSSVAAGGAEGGTEGPL
jgi:Fe-S oxidoreductase